MSSLEKLVFPSPLGEIGLWIFENKAVCVHFGKTPSLKNVQYLKKNFPNTPQKELTCHPYKEKILRYLSGDSAKINISFALFTTPFQTRVLMAVRKIRYGEVLSYKDIGQMIGCGGYRAIGNALKANPLPLIIPCHRVVGSHDLGGFSLGRGLPTKKWLLKLERENRPQITNAHQTTDSQGR